MPVIGSVYPLSLSILDDNAHMHFAPYKHELDYIICLIRFF